MKQFYTEKDIEELFKTGTKSLRVNDDIVLTDLAYEKAKRLGLQLVFEGAEAPPLAPVRPYLSNGSARPSAALPPKPKIDPAAPTVTAPQAGPARQEGLAQRIRSAVLARLGNQIDGKLLDTIIERVLKSTGVK